VSHSELSSLDLQRLADLAVEAQRLPSGDEDSSPALVELTERPDERTVAFAKRMLHDPDPARRIVGVRALRDLGYEASGGIRPFSDESVPALIDLLQRETDPDVTEWASSSLGQFDREEAIDPALALIDHPVNKVRYSVASALASSIDLEAPPQRIIDALLRLAIDRSAYVRYSAVWELATWGPNQPEVLRALERVAAGDTDELNRRIARGGVCRLEGIPANECPELREVI
jgi:HEAT repeat protein